MNYSEVLYELGIGQKTIKELAEDFSKIGENAKNNLLNPVQLETLEIAKKEINTLVINPIKNNSEVVQNTLQYSTGGDGQTLKYDVTSGASSFSAYLQNNHKAISGNGLKTADYNVLSHLSYASKWSTDEDYQKAINRENVTVQEYCSELLKHGDKLSNVQRQYLQELSVSERFSGLTIDHSIGNTGAETNGANTRILVLGSGDGHAIISVQGTNGKEEDWETNGAMVQSRPTSEETWVASVIDAYARDYESIDITGHSQGGREAITSAILMSSENRSKINRIISNDGPGYSRDFLARYAQKIDEIENKVLNIRTTKPVVGELLYGIGEIQYVKVIDVVDTESDGKVKNLNYHEGITWYIDENGDYVTTEGPDPSVQTYLAKLSGLLSDDLVDLIGEEKTAYFMQKLISFGGDDKGSFEFKNFADKKLGEYVAFIEEFTSAVRESLDKVTEEQLTSEENFIRCMCRDIADAFGKVSTVLSVIQKTCGKLIAIFPAASPVFGAIIVIVEEIKFITKAFELLFRGIEWIFDGVALDRAIKKKKDREEYVAQNEKINVSIPLLLEAANMLRDAQMWMRAAYSDYQRMLHGFQGKLRAAISDELGVSEETQEKWSVVPYVVAKTHCWARGVRDFDKADPYLGKACNIVSEIAEDSMHVVPVEEFSGDSIFTVYPARLSDAASKGASCYELVHEELTNIETGVNDLGKSWKGDDYDSIKQMTQTPILKSEDYSKSLGESFGMLISIATEYSKYQESTIEKFQNIDLYFA